MALSLVPFLFALVVLAHRATGAWAAVRERRWPPDSAREALVGLWGAIEVVAAVGFLLLLAVFVGGLLTAATTLSGEAFSLSIRSAFGAAAALIPLVVAVAARLAATALVRVGSRVAATRS